jgi:antirestriction protein ArdC
MTDTKANPYERITAKILADLERGVRPWTKPWSAEHLGGRVVRPLRATGGSYSGINFLLLWIKSVAIGYASCPWPMPATALRNGGVTATKTGRIRRSVA